MTRTREWALGVLCLAPALGPSAPSVYPTGTTIYDPARAWSGYTVLSPLGTQAAIVIDMNGNIVKRWDGYNSSAGGPARVLPGGAIVAAAGARPPHQEALELVQRDFAGNVVWRFDRNEEVETRDGATIWSLRQHHDWQRDDFPAGYYSPGAEPNDTGSKTLVLTHTTRIEPAVSDVMLEDDRIIEVTWEGEIVWEWIASEHIDELGFDSAARAAIEAAPGFNAARGGGFDWLHLNSATYLGPNPWFDGGDSRFDPANIIVSSRQASLMAIIDRDGSVVWRLGPDFSQSEELRAIRQVIGQHQAHLIPKGLPGAGNVLVFDNGGASGYGFANPIALEGSGALVRPNSRVLEIDPVTPALVWSYSAPGQFFASNISGAQRLPNGNTLITEGTTGRIFEVTSDATIVWEYVSPLFSSGAGPRPSNAVYRAYRLPYEWIPQLDRPEEEPVRPPALDAFVLPAAAE